MKRKFITFLLISAIILSGCKNKQSQDSDSENGSPSGTLSQLDTSDLFSDRDYEIGYNVKDCVRITLNGTSASCDSKSVSIKGSTISILSEGTYLISGTLDDGMIIVNTDKKEKTQLILDNASIHSSTSAPLYILQSDKTFVTTAQDSENSLSNGGSFEAIDDNNIDAVIFSKEDLTLNGAGTLTISSPAGHGIVSKDELTISSGTYEINSASHGICGKDNVCIANATMIIDAGKDGIQGNNDEDGSLGFVYIRNGTFSIESEGDGISASSLLQIDGGTFSLLCGGGSENGEQKTSSGWGGFMGGGPGGMGGNPPGRRSATSSQEDTSDDSTSIKGLKASGNLLISDGTFTIDAADDTIHSNSSITISGGTFTLSSGDDGVHADETLDITDGTITISESYEGLEALHVNVSGGIISLYSSDDGLNAAGGTDSSGYGGNRGNDMFGGPGGGMGGPGGGSSNGSINISGGKLYVNASGDGMDANGTLTISGGYTVVCGPTQGDTATLDYDKSAVITGGTFIGTGAAGMAQTFSDSEQGVFAVSVGSQAAGTTITLEDQEGNVLIEYAPDLNFAVVILSCPEMVKGETYKITVGNASGEFEAS